MISGEELMETTVTKSALVRWRWILTVGRKVLAGTLAFQYLNQWMRWNVRKVWEKWIIPWGWS